MLTYRNDPKRMESLFSSPFANRNPTWADTQNLLNTLLTSKECCMPPEQAREEANQLHGEIPNNSLRADAMMAVATTDPNWNVNTGDGGQLEYYQDRI